MVFLDLRYKRRFLELVTGVGIVAIRVHNRNSFSHLGSRHSAARSLSSQTFNPSSACDILLEKK